MMKKYNILFLLAILSVAVSCSATVADLTQASV